MELPPEWNPGLLRHSPLFAPLQPVLACLDSGAFPGLHDYNALLAVQAQCITVHSGMPLRFVAQEQGRLPFEAQYEPRCYLRGEVQTREHNWHDLFNALVWLTFPKAKAAINARHYRALVDDPEKGKGPRGKARDMLTLLDESGVLVACADPELERLLREFEWKELFWEQRERLASAMEFYVFGHGLYEKALQPYVGMTGHGLLLPVAREFFGWPLLRRLTHLDELLAADLTGTGHCRCTGDLTPVPVLGVPGWSEQSQHPDFYGDYSYFRGRRLSSQEKRICNGESRENREGVVARWQ